MNPIEIYEKKRFYKLDRPIKKGMYLGKEVDIVSENIKDGERFKPEYGHLKEHLKNPIQYICISDANSFIERLVFTAIRDEKTGKCFRTSVVIDGKNTFSICGGDADSVYPDEVYIRHLMMINK